MTDTLPFYVDPVPVAAFCRSHGIVRLAIFGSALRAALPVSSDVDVLVEFAPGQTPGFGFFAIQDDLSQLFGRRVDLQTPAFLSKYFRDEVRAQARVVYAA